MKEIQHALVGAIIAKPDLLADVSRIVAVSDFSDNRAALVYSTVYDMWCENVVIDTMTVFTRINDLLEYIAESGNVGFISNVMQYAKDIAEYARKMRLKVALSNIDFGKGRRSKEITEDLIEICNKETVVAKKDSSIASIMKRFDSHVAENKNRGHLGLNTGFDFMSEVLIQYARGHMWTMGGFTSAGKTAMMVQMLVRLFRNNPDPKVVVISTEMTEEQMVARIIANLTGIHSQRILAGNFHPGEEEVYLDAREYVSSLNLHIYEDIYKLSEIETAARKHKLRGGLDVVFIDYVQNCTASANKSEYQAQSTMAKAFQKIAKDVSATFICLSQVSNDVGRGGTDNFELKGAGEWAAVTDVGLMLQRNKADDRALKCTVKKNRHGAKPEQIFKYNRSFTRLQEDSGYVRV